MSGRLAGTGAALLALVLGGCVTAAQTNPSRTATEQMLIAHAAEQAAKQFKLPFKPGTKIHLLAANFRGEGGDYALSALRASFAAQKMVLTARPEDAEVVVEMRMAALSIDETNRMVGIPAVTLPNMASLSIINFPELTVYARRDRTGVAEFLAFAYDARTGAPIAVDDHVSGFTQIRAHKALMVFSWGKRQVRPGDPALGDDAWWKVW